MMKQLLYILSISIYLLASTIQANESIEYDMRSKNSGWAKVIQDSLTGKAFGKKILFKINNIGLRSKIDNVDGIIRRVQAEGMKAQTYWVYDYIYLVSNIEVRNNLLGHFIGQKMGWVTGTIIAVENGRPVIEYQRMVQDTNSITVQDPIDFEVVNIKEYSLINENRSVDFNFIKSSSSSSSIKLEEAFEYALSGSLFFKSIRIQSEKKTISLIVKNCSDGVTDYLSLNQYLICKLSTNIEIGVQSISTVHVYGNIDILSALYFSSDKKGVMPIILSGDIMNLNPNSHFLDINLID